MKIKEICSDLKHIFVSAIDSILPKYIIKNNLHVDNNIIRINSNTIPVRNNCYIVGFGKAVLGMCRQVEFCLNDHIQEGILSIPKGIVSNKNYDLRRHSNIRVFEGAENNIPDYMALKATQEILKLICSLKMDDLLLVLISGGGSALLTYPSPPITLEEKIATIEILGKAGASIKELNAVRRMISLVKGGQLANYTKARVLSLIISDVIGDSLPFIASGPTVKDVESTTAAIDIVKKYSLMEKLPKAVITLLQNYEPPQLYLEHVTNVLVANNSTALEAASKTSKLLGYDSFIATSSLQGRVEDVAEMYVELSSTICQFLDGDLNDCTFCKKMIKLGFGNVSNFLIKGFQMTKLCLIFGGETTVFVKGKGKGGRNQELALRFSVLLKEKFKLKDWNVCLLSAGTDGIDGCSEAAGAIAYLGQIEDGEKQGLDPNTILLDNNSFSYYSQLKFGEDHIITGHTGTNVMDLHLLVIERTTNNTS